MTLQKRDCPIKIRAYPTGSQFSCVEFDIHADHFRFAPSAALGCHFGDFAKALYALYCEEFDPHNEWNSCHSEAGENGGIEAMVSKVEWDNEGELLYITMRRSWLPDAEDIIELKLETELVMPPFQKTYRVAGRDLCYAVGKCCTELLKKYGVYGYHTAAEGDLLPLHQVLFLKAHGLQVQEPRMLRAVDPFVTGTDFEKEVELLRFDM